MQFLLFLGRKVDLNFAEAQEVLQARFGVKPQRLPLVDVALVELSSIEDAVQVQIILGGTIKIAQVLEVIPHGSTQTIEEHIAKALLSLNQHSVSFGIAELGRESLDAVSLKAVKKLLKKQGISARFVEGPRFGLSASVLLHQDIEEICAVRSENQVYIALTIAIQNIDDWTKRDREKPRVDRKKGMLPPKVARILVNLASPSDTKESILDPFCGTGTILLESMMLGKVALGSDVRQEAIDQTKENCEWYTREYPQIQSEYEAHVADVTHLGPTTFVHQIGAIAAEGYLGPLTPDPKKLDQLFKGLEKLYWGMFRQLSTFLKSGTRLCVALPSVEVRQRSYSLESVVDRAKQLGYNTISGPFFYDRPDASVKREIFLLEFRK